MFIKYSIFIQQDLDQYQSYHSSLLNQLRRWQSVPYNQPHGTWKSSQGWCIRLLICISFKDELFQTWNFALNSPQGLHALQDDLHY